MPPRATAFRTPRADRHVMPTGTCAPPERGASISWTVATACENGGETRVLVAMEDEYRAYREVIAAGIRALRPGAKATTVPLGALEEEVARLDPQVVICSRPEPAGAGAGLAWVELSPDPIRPMKVRLGVAAPTAAVGPTLEGLLAVLDEVEELSATGGTP